MSWINRDDVAPVLAVGICMTAFTLICIFGSSLTEDRAEEYKKQMEELKKENQELQKKNQEMFDKWVELTAKTK